ncbi:MAG: hypothetical protein LBU39_12080 [Desulfobulbaceae bacterium]|jgi:hypothetical protein|nr:hypothetical protein [Desulfobulbaceae bacterium]
MSIRHLAVALYQSMKEIGRLEEELAQAASPARQKALADELRRELANRRAIQRMIDGAKETGR